MRYQHTDHTDILALINFNDDKLTSLFAGSRVGSGAKFLARSSMLNPVGI
jgi:hypothetical protein